MKTNLNSNENKKSIDSSLEPSDFYFEKRGDATNVFSILDDAELSDQKKTDNIENLNSFYIPTDDEKTKKIFDEVISYQNTLSKKNKRELDLTDEILQVNFKNDDVFVKDVIESYEKSFMPPVKKEEENLDSSKIFNFIDEKPKNTQNDHFENSNSKLDEFVSTKHINNSFFDDENNDQKIISIKETLENVYANRDELHKSIQIALDDVKKHHEDDFVLNNIGEVDKQNMNISQFDDNNIVQNNINLTKTFEFANVDDKDDLKVVYDDNQVSELFHPKEFPENNELAKMPNIEVNTSFNNEEEINPIYNKNFKNKDDNFFFIDNTVNSKRYSENFTSLQNDNLHDNDQPVEVIDDRVKELIREQVQEEINKIQQTQKISFDLEEKLDQQREILENQAKAFENAQEELMSKHDKIINDAELLKEQMLLNAQNQIELEREQLKNEREQLLALENKIQQDKLFLEQQRQALLDATKKETERLINTALLDEKNDNSSTDISATFKNEINKSDNDLSQEVDNSQIEEPVFSEDANLFENTLNQKNAEYEKLLDNFETSIKKFENINESSNNSTKTALSDMEPIVENRSYTEKIIDSIEIDDYDNEEVIPIPTIPLTFSNQGDFSAKDTNNGSEYQPTVELKNDVDVMRRALKNTRNNNDFDFEEKRLAYEKEKVKEEIKQEILKEMSLYTNDAIGLNTTIPAINMTDSLDEDSDTLDIEHHINEAKNNNSVTLRSSEKVPELSAHTHSKNSNFSNDIYDIDLFDDLGIDSFESNDIVDLLNKTKETKLKIDTDIEKLTNDLKSEQFPMFVEPSPLSSVSFNPFYNNSPSPQKADSNFNKEFESNEKPKIKLRRAQLSLNKKRDDSNLSSAELIKSIAKQIKRKSSLKK